MTSDVELLPLPIIGEGFNAADIRELMTDYARANVAHAIAPLQAEVEALQEELGCLQQRYDERTACVIVHRGSAIACSDVMRAAYSDERRRAERLAEALREAADDLERGIDARIVVAQLRARADLLRE